MTSALPLNTAAPRVDWVDIAKGFCIIFVVMMHSTLGVGEAMGRDGWMHAVVSFAAPFRMPDFFLIAGLFLSARIDRPWRSYLDTKVLHFAYFYVLWLTIQFAFKSPSFAADYGVLGVIGLYFKSFFQPFGTLWFIYMLPIFFIFSKALRGRAHWSAVLAFGALLEIASVHTGVLLIDEFCARFVYFYAGYALAPHIFRLAAEAGRHPVMAGAMIGLWALGNGILVAEGASTLPVISLLLGFAGAGAIVVASVFLTMVPVSRILRYLGENSIVVYLSFFFPMVVMRTALLKLGFADVGTISLLVTIAGVVGPVIFFMIVNRLDILGFLFKRPRWARITPEQRRWPMVPAE